MFGISSAATAASTIAGPSTGERLANGALQVVRLSGCESVSGHRHFIAARWAFANLRLRRDRISGLGEMK
jgi:hypothetical protein